MCLKILILAPMLPATGNTSTVKRLQCHFIKNKVNCSIMCSHELLENTSTCIVKSLNKNILQFNSNALLLLHAFKSGSCLTCQCENYCKVCVKYGVIFGGTDINEDIKDEFKFNTIRNCIENASFCVAFNKVLLKVVKALFPSAQLYHQVQAIDYELYDSCSIDCNLDNLSEENMKPFVFVLPCSIRQVKDPLYVVEKIQEIRHKTKKDVRLLIIGPVTDSSYAQLFFDEICSVTSQKYTIAKKSMFVLKPSCIPCLDDGISKCSQLEKWLEDTDTHEIQYVPAIAQKDLFLLLKKGCFNAVLNTSLSEGMSSILLEAMAIGVPILARNIAGNQAIIHDNETGLLFSTLDEFVDKAIRYLEDSHFCKSIASAAYSYVFNNHSPYLESKFYLSLCKTLIE